MAAAHALFTKDSRRGTDHAALKKIGDVTVTKIVGAEDDNGDMTGIIPKATREAVLPIAWLKPDFMNDDGGLRLSIHALVVETPSRRILVDTCVGNDKQRPGIPDWHKLQLPFLKQLEEAGYKPERIDTVVCTHLHVDHVGWYTMRVGGRWVPTFPKARYLLGRAEFAYWQTEQAAGKHEGFAGIRKDDVFVDSGRPSSMPASSISSMPITGSAMKSTSCRRTATRRATSLFVSSRKARKARTHHRRLRASPASSPIPIGP